MIVSDKKRFIYFHTPKTGGSSITAALAPWSNRGPDTPDEDGTHGWQCKYHYGPMHNSVARSWSVHGNPLWRKYYWFGFVRNPFDLVVSAWKMRAKVYADPGPVHEERFRKLGVPFPIENISLEQFLEIELGVERLLHIRRTQSLHLLRGAPRKLDFIGKFERLQEDWKTIQDRLKIDAPLPHRNRSEREQGYRQYYSPETRSIVENFYEEDFVNFDYDW